MFVGGGSLLKNKNKIMSETKPYEVRHFGKLLYDAWIAYKKSFWRFLGVAAIFLVINAAFMLLFGLLGNMLGFNTVEFGLNQAKGFTFETSVYEGIGWKSFTFAGMLYNFGMFLIFNLIVSYQLATLIFTAKSAVQKTEGTVGSFLKEGSPFVVKLFFANLVVVFLTLLGLPFLLVGAIVVAVYLVFVPYVIVLEKKAVFESISRGYRVVKSDFWRVLWYTLLFNVIFGILLLIPFINIVTLIIIIGLGPTFMYSLYHDLAKKKKEA